MTTLLIALFVTTGWFVYRTSATRIPALLRVVGLQTVAQTTEADNSVRVFQNRRKYKRLNRAILATIPDDDVEQAIFDYADEKVAAHGGDERVRAAKLSVGVRSLYLTTIVENEVQNGGFNQYYWNTNGTFASDAVDAFEYFGASEHAQVMREANAVRAAETAALQKYKDKNSIDAFIKSYEYSKLGPLDDRYFKLNEDLSRLRITRIRATPEEFSGD